MFWSAAFSWGKSQTLRVSSYSSTWQLLREASFFTIYFIVFMVSWIAIRTSSHLQMLQCALRGRLWLWHFCTFCSRPGQILSNDGTKHCRRKFWVHCQWFANGKLKLVVEIGLGFAKDSEIEVWYGSCRRPLDSLLLCASRKPRYAERETCKTMVLHDFALSYPNPFWCFHSLSAHRVFVADLLSLLVVTVDFWNMW